MKEIEFKSDVTVELIDMMGSEQRIVQAARVSTKGAHAEAQEAKGLVRFLVREKHEVPLEHCVMTFRIHAPIFVTRQILKHRLTSISEESGRYRELDPVFYTPAPDRKVKQVGKTGDYEFVDDEEANLISQDLIEESSLVAWGNYSVMINIGVAKEVARTVLPTNLYSTMYMTINLRSALNFIALRTARYGSHPQHEIALVGERVRDVLAEHFPTVLEAWEARGRER